MPINIKCRAECVAMYLGVNKQVLAIFGHENQQADDVMFISYLSMARAGLTSLEFYDPETSKWGQAHMQARFAILQVFIESGLVSLEFEDGNIVINMDREKIETVGVEAIGNFLMKLNVYKSTGDAVEGTNFYNDATKVASEKWLNIRETVLSNKQPRKMFVQGNSFVKDNQVFWKDYEPTLEGIVESFLERDLCWE